MRAAGIVVADALAAVQNAAQVGVSCARLDAVATEVIRSAGAEPSFPMVPGYRHTLCVSVNEAVVHGIPSDRPLRRGDLVSVDCGAQLNGWNGDAAVTFVVGGEEAGRLEDVTLLRHATDALWAGIAAFQVGEHLFGVGEAIEESLLAAARSSDRVPYGILEGYEGHGIGRAMHESPGVPNVAVREKGPRIRAGATVAIEPMVTLGSDVGHTLSDEWTVVTVDGSRGVHVEHTVAATPQGPWVLTAHDGGAAELRSRGLPCGAPTTAG